MNKNLHFLFFLFCISNVFSNVTIIPFASSWKYLDDGSNQGTAWTTTGFNDAAWLSGNGQLGYGDGDETTIVGAGCLPVASCSPKYITTYFRKNITIGSTASYLDYTLNVKRDDGIIVYIDGVEVYRNNIAAGVVDYLTLATAAADDGNTIQSTTLTLAQLPTGNHTIAAEVHQNINTSSDITFDLEIVANELTTVSFGAPWKYLDNGTDQGTAWRASTFNDATWLSGNAQLGYGDGDEATVLGYGGNAANKYITTYFRKNITIGNTASFSDFTLSMIIDDGAIVYIDGVEVFRSGMAAGAVSYLTLANTTNDNAAVSTTITLAQLPTGNHTIAVEIHQVNVTSSDISFDLELKANIAGLVNVTRGPYLNLATQNSVHVRWRTNAASNSVVNYGLVDGTLSSSVVDNTLTTEHDVTITGLTNDTKYFYSIGNTNPAIQTLKTGTKYFFQTLPIVGVDRLSRFMIFGDIGNNSSNQVNVRNSMMNYFGTNHADGFILLGDNAYNSGTDAEYTTNFYPQYQDSILRNVILWPSPGNHDYANTAARQNDHVIPYYNMFTLPTAAEAGGVASGTEAFYSYDFANIHFLSLDSYGKEANTYRIWDTLGPQAVWVKNDLAANTQKWTVAYWHHPPYTLGSHTSEGEADLAAIRQNFIRILERLGVDLILCGHSHVYERSYLLNGHYGTETSFNFATHAANDSSSAKYNGTVNSCPYIKNAPKTTGTVYAVVGSSGQLGGVQTGWPINAMAYSNNANGGAMALKVEGNRLDAEWVCADGVVRDRFTMMKDVNKKNTLSVTTGNIVNMSSSWLGNYNWSNVGILKDKSYTTLGNGIDTVTVTDNFNCLKDSFIITKNLQLPVELLSFNATNINNQQVQLNWSTASEKNNATFEIEWSTDGINFTKIGEQIGFGSTSEIHNYQYIHQQPTAGINYYRLKQIDFDFNFSYSKIVSVNIDKSTPNTVKNNFIYVYPNPSKNGLFNVDYYSNQNLNSNLVVYDILGNEVFKDAFKIHNGIAHYLLNMSSFSKGNYLLKIENETVQIQK